MRSSGSRMKPARVANDDADTGTLNAPWTWPAACDIAGRTSSTVAEPVLSSLATGPDARTNGPLFSTTTRAVVGGRGVATDAELAMNSCRSPNARAAFERFSDAMVVERAGLIAAPQSEPATWPG